MFPAYGPSDEPLLKDAGAKGLVPPGHPPSELTLPLFAMPGGVRSGGRSQQVCDHGEVVHVHAVIPGFEFADLRRREFVPGGGDTVREGTQVHADGLADDTD
ncbi:hypothetical protein [Lysinibacter sp. HNR]|uniref:hypothetical protein n=1 Tax=Lysinibacter sp. HNR TaxID=3031408 RepID=UPI002435A434|nr:hypothetical protein [Lysinibacter sp. HNR]WGD37370.1 hypothetical protein FrondiHNR_00150 [Lysinibacter sp. HNR]